MSEQSKSNHLKTVNSLEEIPTFSTEAEEAEFWATHEAGDGLFDAAAGSADTAALMDALPKRPRSSSAKSNPTSLRLGTELERRLRHLAQLKGTSYQTLLKEFVLERVYEEEKRLNVI